jgi:hypothetical protein
MAAAQLSTPKARRRETKDGNAGPLSGLVTSLEDGSDPWASTHAPSETSARAFVTRGAAGVTESPASAFALFQVPKVLTSADINLFPNSAMNSLELGDRPSFSRRVAILANV